MHFKGSVLSACLILTSQYVIHVDCATSGTLPSHLIECYKNGGIRINAPHNIQLLVELINKIEHNNRNLNVRVLSSSILHSLKLDGIERSKNVVETEYVIPYRATAFQLTKFNFLMDLLIPGEKFINIHEGLDISDICTLHMLISSAVDPWERGDELNVCPITMVSNLKSDVPSGSNVKNIWDSSNHTGTERLSSYSRCPIENGVVQTHWGNISPGTLIAGISAALEPQSVNMKELWKAAEGYELTPKSFKTPDELSDMNARFEQWGDLQNEFLSDQTISNILAATLSGDIAELAIRQGPIVQENDSKYSLGPGGKWNDSIIPRNMHLAIKVPYEWEMTDAEILAGIDAYIISQYVKEWTSTLDRVRLSQIIEMYYSSYGIAFDTGIRACHRKQNMAKLFKDSNIYEETLNLVNILWYTLSTVHITQNKIAEITNAAVDAFQNYWPILLDTLPDCNVLGDTSPMDVILVTDGSWPKYETEQLVSILSETLDVSNQGSSLGLMHGSTGEWLAPSSHSILEIFDSIFNSTDDWPYYLNLPSVLTSLITHLQNTTDQEILDMEVAALPHVIIIAAPITVLSDADLERTRKIIETLRSSLKDIYFVYITKDTRAFETLAIDPHTHADVLIESSQTDVKTLAEMIRLNFIEKPLPKRLIPPPCQSSKSSIVRQEHEDYINVGQKVLYRIHPINLLYVPVVKIQFQGTSHGEISVCISRKYTEDAATSCKIVNSQYDANFQVNYPCNGAPFCEPIYFIIRARSSLITCNDKDCRYPDQIRYVIRHDGLECRGTNGTSNGNKQNFHVNNMTHISLLILLICITLCMY